MPTILKTKNSVTTTVVPTTLQQGELAVNITDKKMWVGNAATTPVQLFGAGADSTFTNISVSGVATFGAGTVSAPSITTTGDTNTGIFFPAADTIAFTEGGVEAMRISSSANVGIGTGSPTARLCISGNQSFVERTDAYIGVDVATVGGNGGSLSVKAGAGSGSGNFAGNLLLGAGRGNASASTGYIGFGTAIGTNTVGLDAEYMRINSSGQVLIGTTTNTGSRKLNVVGSIASTFSDANDNQLIIGATSSTAFVSSSYGTTGAYRPLTFETNGTERMRIDTSGNVGIGVTNPSQKLEVAGGIYIKSGGSTSSLFYDSAAVFSQAGVGERMRIESDGDVNIGSTTQNGTQSRLYVKQSADSGFRGLSVVSNAAGEFVGSFSMLSSGILEINQSYLAGSGSYQPITFVTAGSERVRITTNAEVLFEKTTNSYTTYGGMYRAGSFHSAGGSDFMNCYSTSGSAYRFYVSNTGTIFATSTTITAISDQRLKENVRDLDFGLSEIMSLQPRKFDWKKGKGLDKKDDVGFIAQEFETVFPNSVNTSKAGADGIEYKTVNHSELIPTLVKAIQELKAEFDAYKATHP
jgi:hypothetical protein